MDEEFKDTERDELLAELRAELDELKEEVSGLREGDKIHHAETERKVTTHFMDDFNGDEDDAAVQDTFGDFVIERYAGTTGTMQLPDSTDLIIARYNDCLKMCYLMRIDDFAQQSFAQAGSTLTASPILVREELVGNGGTSFPKMVFIFWDTCGGAGESCDTDLTVCRDMAVTSLYNTGLLGKEWRCGNSQDLFQKHEGTSENLYNSSSGTGECHGDGTTDPLLNDPEGPHAYNRSDDGGYTKGAAVMVVTDVECERIEIEDENGYGTGEYQTWLNVGHRELRFDSCGKLLGISRRVISSSKDLYSEGCFMQAVSTDP